MLGLFNRRADRDLASWRGFILDYVQQYTAGGDVYEAVEVAMADIPSPRSIQPRPTVNDTATWVEEQLTLLAAIDADGGDE